MADYFYKVLIEPQAEGGFTAYVPSLPGCVSEGETCRETLDHIREALMLSIETLKERRRTMITDNVHITELCV